MNNSLQIAQLQQRLPELSHSLQNNREITLIICAGVAVFSVVQIFKGWRLHQLATQFFGALLGAVIGVIAAGALRGLLFSQPLAADMPFVLMAVALGFIGLTIGFRVARFDVTTLARTGFTFEGDGVHTVYGIIWSHAFVGALLLAGAMFATASAFGVIPQGREHFALVAASVLALVIGIKGAFGQTTKFIRRGP